MKQKSASTTTNITKEQTEREHRVQQHSCTTIIKDKKHRPKTRLGRFFNILSPKKTTTNELIKPHSCNETEKNCKSIDDTLETTSVNSKINEEIKKDDDHNIEKVVVLVEMNNKNTSRTTTPANTLPNQFMFADNEEPRTSYPIDDIELLPIEPPRQFQNNNNNNNNNNHNSSLTCEDNFVYDFVNESTCRRCLGEGSTGADEYCLDCDDYRCDPFDDDDDNDLHALSDCDSVGGDLRDSEDEADNSSPLTIIYNESSTNNADSLIAVPLPAYRLPAQRKQAAQQQQSAVTMESRAKLAAAALIANSSNQCAEYQAGEINCVRQLVPISVYNQPSGGSSTSAAILVNNSSTNISSKLKTAANKTVLNGPLHLGGQPLSNYRPVKVAQSTPMTKNTTTLVQIHSQTSDPNNSNDIIRPPSSLPLHPQTDVQETTATKSGCNQNSINYRYFPVARTQPPVSQHQPQHLSSFRMTDIGDVGGGNGHSMSLNSQQQHRLMVSSTHSSPLLHHHHHLFQYPSSQSGGYHSPLLLLPESGDYRRHSMQNNYNRLPLYATLNSNKGTVEAACPSTSTARTVLLANTNIQQHQRSMITPDNSSGCKPNTSRASALVANNNNSALSNESGYYHYVNAGQQHHHHQRQQQQQLMQRELNYNQHHQQHQEELLKNEEKMRELKGYEASTQYLIPDKYGQGQTSSSAGGSFDYGANVRNVSIGGDIFEDENIEGESSHKRSCSQWRMTLFVFYWIIWIVFLIGVVIIVAANARTA